MIKQDYRSKCCNAEARTEGVPDFIGSEEVCTVSFVCLECGKFCDVVKRKGQKQKVRAADKSIRTALKEKIETLATKKRIKKLGKRLDFRDEILQKLAEFLDGITIHLVKGVILTPKKKRQLAEWQKMEQTFIKSKIKKLRK